MALKDLDFSQVEIEKIDSVLPVLSPERQEWYKRQRIASMTQYVNFIIQEILERTVDFLEDEEDKRFIIKNEKDIRKRMTQFATTYVEEGMEDQHYSPIVRMGIFYALIKALQKNEQRIFSPVIEEVLTQTGEFFSHIVVSDKKINPLTDAEVNEAEKVRHDYRNWYASSVNRAAAEKMQGKLNRRVNETYTRRVIGEENAERLNERRESVFRGEEILESIFRWTEKKNKEEGLDDEIKEQIELYGGFLMQEYLAELKMRAKSPDRWLILEQFAHITDVTTGKTIVGSDNFSESDPVSRRTLEAVGDVQVLTPLKGTTELIEEMPDFSSDSKDDIHARSIYERIKNKPDCVAVISDICVIDEASHCGLAKNSKWDAIQILRTEKKYEHIEFVVASIFSITGCEFVDPETGNTETILIDALNNGRSMYTFLSKNPKDYEKLTPEEMALLKYVPTTPGAVRKNHRVTVILSKPMKVIIPSTGEERVLPVGTPVDLLVNWHDAIHTIRNRVQPLFERKTASTT